jgi:hypothetical protein
LHLTLFLYTPTFYFLSKIQLSRNLIWKPCSITNISWLIELVMPHFPFLLVNLRYFHD